MSVGAEQFASLVYAYGLATDTPRHPVALRDGDDNARAAAMEHLWSAVIDQGTPWTATPPAANVLAEFRGATIGGMIGCLPIVDVWPPETVGYMPTFPIMNRQKQPR